MEEEQKAKEELVWSIIERYDEIRDILGCNSQAVIENGKVYMATTEYDGHGADLIVETIDKFIEDYTWVFDEEFEEFGT